jgi:ATP-dependent RNA helicase RhlE
MPNEISKLAHDILEDPKKVEVTPAATTVERIEQTVMFVEKQDKFSLLLKLLENKKLFKVLVFVQMKHGADKVVDKLEKNRIPCAAIHGNKSQNNRQRAIENFTNDKIRVLVATDIASRGIDIDGITHVINFDLPNVPEDYVHRIGRTARAGADGQAISFCTGEEKSYLFAIEKTTRQKITVITDQPFHSAGAQNASIMSVGKAKAMIEGRRDAGRSYGPRRGGARGGARGGRRPSGGGGSRSR